jgi:hypothetical protein
MYMAKKNPNYHTTRDLMERWGCGYKKANAFMHRRGSGAIKPAGRLLISEIEIIVYEQLKRVNPKPYNL